MASTGNMCALQLAVYGLLHALRTGCDAVPSTAYFSLSRGRLITTEPARFGLVRGVDGPPAAGIHRIAWDLRKASTPAGPGDRIAPGNYIVRMTVNGRITTAGLEVRTDPNRGR